MTKRGRLKKEASDEFGIFVPDILMPDEEDVDSDIVEDECDCAYKYAFVAAGQGGSKIAESFYNLGYRRICAINTTEKDLININIPEENKLVMDVGQEGAGKDPSKGQKAIKQHYEDVYDLMMKSFGKEFDRIIIVAALGGGSGTGCIETLIEISHDVAKANKLEEKYGEPVVGVLATMPSTSEGQKVNANAAVALDLLFRKVGKGRGKLDGRTISPLLIIDNDRIDKIYPNLPVSKFYTVANQSVSNLFHLFNSMATKDSDIVTFDRADYGDVLSGGILTLGMTQISKFESANDISSAIRDNLKRNILVANTNIKTAKSAACIFLGHPYVFEELPQKYLEHGFDMLSRMMRDGSVVHRGIYQGNIKDKNGEPSLVVYTLLGDLGRPMERMEEIYNIGNIPQRNNW